MPLSVRFAALSPVTENFNVNILPMKELTNVLFMHRYKALCSVLVFLEFQCLLKWRFL